MHSSLVWYVSILHSIFNRWIVHPISLTHLHTLPYFFFIHFGYHLFSGPSLLFDIHILIVNVNFCTLFNILISLSKPSTFHQPSYYSLGTSSFFLIFLGMLPNLLSVSMSPIIIFWFFEFSSISLQSSEQPSYDHPNQHLLLDNR